MEVRLILPEMKFLGYFTKNEVLGLFCQEQVRILEDQINILGRLGYYLNPARGLTIDRGRGHNVGQGGKVSSVVRSRKQHSYGSWGQSNRCGGVDSGISGVQSPACNKRGMRGE